MITDIEVQKEIPELPTGCGYEGNDFGASYPDSKCFGGRLYDLDNCDSDGNLYDPLAYVYCPKCQHSKWREQFRESIEVEGYQAYESGKPETSCPYPKCGLKYPKDNTWLKRCWQKGFRDAMRESKGKK